MGDHAPITGIATIVGAKGARAFGSIALGDALCGVGEAWHCHPSCRPGHHRPADGSVRPLPKKNPVYPGSFWFGKEEGEGGIRRENWEVKKDI